MPEVRQAAAQPAPRVIVAGHLCVDVIPQFGVGARLPAQGGLAEVGPALFSTGGAVPNTGLVLNRLGMPARLIARVGDDDLGRIVIDRLERVRPGLSDDLIVTPGEATSYSIVLSLPGLDRTFLHCPGVNELFCASDVTDRHLEDVRVMHFGYPPLMRRMREGNGEELLSLFHRAKTAGAMTSLDMTMPDPRGASGQINWPQLLRQVLPQVDLFLPSVEEVRVMLGRPADESLADLASIARELLEMGAAVVGLKLGDRGFYLHTVADRGRVAGAGLDPQHWANRQLWAPCFEVDVVGTTGAGDCTIAGFLAALVENEGPESALRLANAVGACCVEASDAVSGVPTLDQVRSRIANGWRRRELALATGWREHQPTGVFTGPSDGGADRRGV